MAKKPINRVNRKPIKKMPPKKKSPAKKRTKKPTTAKPLTEPKKKIVFRGTKMNLYDVYPTRGGAETVAKYNRMYNNPYLTGNGKLKQHIEQVKGGHALYVSSGTRESIS